MVLFSSLAGHFILSVTFSWLPIGDSNSKTRIKKSFQDFGTKLSCPGHGRAASHVCGAGERDQWKPVFPGGGLSSPLPLPARPPVPTRCPSRTAFQVSQSDTRVGNPWPPWNSILEGGGTGRWFWRPAQPLVFLPGSGTMKSLTDRHEDTQLCTQTVRPAANELATRSTQGADLRGPGHLETVLGGRMWVIP